MRGPTPGTSFCRRLARGIAWRLFLNTAADSPADIYPSLDGPPLSDNSVVTMEARSMIVYVARDVRARAASGGT